MRSQYTVILTSHPTDLDGTGIMYLLHRPTEGVSRSS
jgi:hypothetical protein